MNLSSIGKLTPGDLVLVSGLLQQLARPLGFLGSTYRDMTQSLTDLKSMMGLLELKALENKPNAIDASTIIQSQPKIEFNNVMFSYDPKKQLFNNLTFDIQPGKKIAIVGGSGSGKSTIVRLLYRFYEIESGSIKINDTDIRDFEFESLRKQIGVVPQDCVLFHDSIYHNISYGDLSVTKEQVIQAAKMADLHETILKQPDGYDSIVGERGLKLSGGEKQRLAIARAMLKQPNILIYDEATSSLDSITEQNILKALKNITKDRTTIVIAHRLSTIMDCDEIIVIGSNGEVAQKGNHEALIQIPGRYKDLWDSQNIRG